MSYVGAGKSDGVPVVDLRSDTVTRPCDAMRAAMASAPVGDDVYFDDPSVNALQDYAADLLGKEAALFMTSGTQSNLVAMLAQCQRGEEVLCGAEYHVFIDEAGGASVLGGVMFAPMPMTANGGLDPDVISRTVKPDDEHCPISRMLTLENSWHGQVQTLAEINAAAQCGKAHGLVVHLDGARMMNAVVKLGVTPAQMVAEADTVSVCLSKGLGTPAGSVLVGAHDGTILAGPKSVIKRAHRIRKLVGGGMRQAGILAAAGLFALQNNIDRLAEDHENALRLAERLADIPGLGVDPAAVQTNMVFVDFPEGSGIPLGKHLAKKGMLIVAGSDHVRLVTHRDCGIDQLDQLVAEIAAFYA
ncbi:MAG: low-specificity L-threonine aldolase [Alphaproteobacteria bacterium]